MKLVAVAVLLLALFCNSTPAMAEGPVPFNALLLPAGADPGIPPLDDSKDQSSPNPTQPIHTRMTTGGKVMSGTGLVMLVGGATLLVGTAAFNQSSRGKICCSISSSDQAKLYGVGGGLLAGGATLIIVGAHRREPK